MSVTEIERHSQHPIVRNQKWELDQHGQAAPRRVHALVLIERGDLFVHSRLAGVPQAVFLILLLNRLDLRRHALHLQHGLHLRDAQGQQSNVDDERLQNNGPSPVVDKVIVCPLQPQEERAGEDAPPAEIDQPAKIRVGARNAGNLHGLEHIQRLRAHKYALQGWAVQIADGGANHFVGMLGILRIVDRIAQRDQGRTVGIVGDENGGKVLIQRAGPMQRSVYRGPTADLLYWQTVARVVELIVDEDGSIRGGGGAVS